MAFADFWGDTQLADTVLVFVAGFPCDDGLLPTQLASKKLQACLRDSTNDEQKPRKRRRQEEAPEHAQHGPAGLRGFLGGLFGLGTAVKTQEPQDSVSICQEASECQSTGSCDNGGWPRSSVVIPSHAVVLCAESAHFKRRIKQEGHAGAADASQGGAAPAAATQNAMTDPATGKRVLVEQGLTQAELGAVEAMLRVMYLHQLDEDTAHDPVQLALVCRLADRMQFPRCKAACVAALAALPSSGPGGGPGGPLDSAEALASVMPLLEGVELDASSRQTLDTLFTERVVGLFKDASAVASDPATCEDFCSLPYAAVRLWAASEQLQGHENAVVWLIDRWYQHRLEQQQKQGQHQQRQLPQTAGGPGSMQATGLGGDGEQEPGAAQGGEGGSGRSSPSAPASPAPFHLAQAHMPGSRDAACGAAGAGVLLDTSALSMQQASELSACVRVRHCTNSFRFFAMPRLAWLQPQAALRRLSSVMAARALNDCPYAEGEPIPSGSMTGHPLPGVPPAWLGPPRKGAKEQQEQAQSRQAGGGSSQAQGGRSGAQSSAAQTDKVVACLEWQVEAASIEAAAQRALSGRGGQALRSPPLFAAGYLFQISLVVAAGKDGRACVRACFGRADDGWDHAVYCSGTLAIRDAASGAYRPGAPLDSVYGLKGTWAYLEVLGPECVAGHKSGGSGKSSGSSGPQGHDIMRFTVDGAVHLRACITAVD